MNMDDYTRYQLMSASVRTPRFLASSVEEIAAKSPYLLPSELQGDAIRYEFTYDKGLLHQYYELRKRVYADLWELTDESAGEDFYDHSSHILVAKLGKLCVAGARLTVKSPDISLPMEDEEFNLAKMLPDYALERNNYAEFSGVCMLPQFREHHAQDLYNALIMKAVSLGVRYVFSIDSLAKLDEKSTIFHHMGINTYNILENIRVSSSFLPSGGKNYLTCIDLQALSKDGSGISSAAGQPHHFA